jgi:hypothetical protein
MKVLLIGDEHTYGYGLSGGNLSYIGHFIRQISRTGSAVSVEAYAHLSLSQMIAALAHLPLSRYDLIMLHLDYTLDEMAYSPVSHSSVMSLPLFPDLIPSPGAKPFVHVRGRLRQLINQIRSLIWPTEGRKSLSILLDLLRPYRHNVLLITPFPHQKIVNRWLRQRSRAVLIHEADKLLVSVFDVDAVIRPGEEYFLPNDPEHLNAVSHELLGRSLFDFYESSPTIITIQGTRGE